MAGHTIDLESLEQIISAPDDRRLAEAALAALRQVAAGDHFSAILFNTKERAVEDYFLDRAWRASDAAFWPSARHGLADHPLARRFYSRPQSVTLARSREVSDPVWKKTWLYNEVERPLGVQDITAVCQITARGQAMILTCARSRRFSDRDLAAVQSYQRVLGRLAPFRAAAPGRSGVAGAAGPLAALTAREQEILHWVRAGKRDPEIGIILGISPRTVSHHLGSIYRKLGVETRTAAAFVQ